MNRLKVIKEEWKSRKLNWSSDLEIPEIDSDVVQYTTFNAPSASGKISLERHCDIRPVQLSFDPKIAKGSFISKKCGYLGLTQRDAVLEWACMNPCLVNEFIERMRSDPGFGRWYNSYYDPVRLVAWRCHSEPTRIVGNEIELNKRVDRMVEEERIEREKAKEVFLARDKRWKCLEKAKAAGGARVRAKWRHKLPKIPGRKSKCGPQKRARSRSRSRKDEKRAKKSVNLEQGEKELIFPVVGLTKRSQCIAPRESGESEVLDVPAPSREVEGPGNVQDEEDPMEVDEVVVGYEIDDEDGVPISRSRKAAPKRPDLRTYDERIEAKIPLFSDEDSDDELLNYNVTEQDIEDLLG